MGNMRDFVTFEAKFQDDSRWNATGDMIMPAGHAIAEELRKAIESRGGTCGEVCQHSFYGWSLAVTCDANTVKCVLAAAEGRWLLQLEPKRSFIDRIRGKADASMLRSAQVCIHESLTSDSRVSHILWYSRQDYECCREDMASPIP